MTTDRPHTAAHTSGFSAFALEPFPEIQPGDDPASVITDVLTRTGTEVQHGDILVDLVAAAAGLILGQRGRGAPVAVLRGISYTASDEGVAAMLHHRP